MRMWNIGVHARVTVIWVADDSDKNDEKRKRQQKDSHRFIHTYRDEARVWRWTHESHSAVFQSGHHSCMYVCRENIHATRLVPLLPRPAHLFEFLVTLLLVFAEFCALQKVHLLKICVFTLCVSLKIVHLLLLLAVLRCESTRLPKIYTYIYMYVCVAGAERQGMTR